MNIPDPRALPGQAVSVLNYRKKPAQWVAGETGTVSYTSSVTGQFRWTYTVWVETSDGDHTYPLYVGDDDIRRRENPHGK